MFTLNQKLTKSPLLVFYHAQCFFEIADAKDPELIRKIWPLTRRNFRYRKLEWADVATGDYLLDGGAERLVGEWCVQRINFLARSLGVEPLRLLQTDPLYRLMYFAGKSDFKYASGPPAALSFYEEYLLLNCLKPFESDGPGDRYEWDLFSTYLGMINNMESLKYNNTLSLVLDRWMFDKVCI